MRSPLEQFKITGVNWEKPVVWVGGVLGEMGIRVNNSTIYTGIAIIIIGLGAMRERGGRIERSKRREIIIRKGYEVIEGIIREMMGEGMKKYIPLLGGMFIFIMINNGMGLIPYTFTITSHIIITITMSITIIIGVTIIGVVKHKGKFIRLFIPSGLNEGKIKYIIPVVFMIELVSYIIRIISLAVRMTANIMSGHTLLKIVSSFSQAGVKGIIGVKTVGKSTIVGGVLVKMGKIIGVVIGVIIPIIIIIGIYILEIGVAIIQSYVFTLLTATYIKDSELLH
jgi:ATP synthase subunit 6